MRRSEREKVNVEEAWQMMERGGDIWTGGEEWGRCRPTKWSHSRWGGGQSSSRFNDTLYALKDGNPRGDLYLHGQSNTKYKKVLVRESFAMASG
jgi:hypothetical protein